MQTKINIIGGFVIRKLIIKIIDKWKLKNIKLLQIINAPIICKIYFYKTINKYFRLKLNLKKTTKNNIFYKQNNLGKLIVAK